MRLVLATPAVVHRSIILTLILFVSQVEECNSTYNGIIEHMYDMPQIRLQDLLSGIPNDDI